MSSTLRIAVCMLAVVVSLSVTAQNKRQKIKGHVTTKDGQPASNVTIHLTGNSENKFSETNDNGDYEFEVKNGQYTLEVKSLGIQTIRKSIVVPPSSNEELNLQINESYAQLESVVVTGGRNRQRTPVSVGKAELPVMDMPQATTVIGEETIANIQAQRLSDVVKNVNGVYLGTTRGSTQESFYARGYAFSSNNMFKNGFRVNSGSMPEMSSLESVEVLKGSASILYGNVAPGGILNMETKKPKFHFGGSVNMRAGSYSLYKPAFDVYGPLSSNIAYRINGTYETANSYRDSVHSKRYYVNPSFLFKLGKNTDLLVQGDYLYHDFTPDFGIGSLSASKTTFGGATIADVPRSRFMGASWQYSKTNQSTVSAELNHRINNNWKLNGGVSYQHYGRDYYSLERVQANVDGKFARPLGKTNNKENYYSGQVNLNGRFHTGNVGHALLIGADADRIETDNLTANVNGKNYDTINILHPEEYIRRSDIPDAVWAVRAKTPTNRFGVYVQDLISITEKLKFLAGVRFSYQDANPAKTDSLLVNKTTTGQHQVDKAFSPRVGLVYQPTSNMSLFASYSNSFMPNTGVDIYNNAIKPSIIDQYELGMKNILFNGRLTANLTLYRINNNNLAQTAEFDANGNENSNTNIKELTGKTTSDGLEIDLKANPVNGLDIMAGYSYNNMRYTKTVYKVGATVEGEGIVNSPKNTANATAFYTITNGALKGFKFGAGWYYTGSRFGGWNSQYTAAGADGKLGINDRRIPVKAFSTIDISAGYTYKQISLLAKLSNITNTYNYYVHENYSINPIPPRQIIATLEYRF